MSVFSQTIVRCIEEAENGVLIDQPNEHLTGFAGDKLTGLIQRLTKAVGKDYLEVGVWRGSSLLNTAYANPDIRCFGVDNYSMHDPGGRNKSIVQEAAKNLDITNYELIDKDFEDGLREFDGEVGVYFIDGPHDYRSQLMCLIYGMRILADRGCILVDDANYVHVRQATKDFLYAFPEYKLVFEAYTDCHPSNMNPKQLAEARQGWWDGVHLIVHDPDNEFETLIPETSDNARYIRDHHVHISRYGPIATEAAMLVESFARPWKIPKGVGRYFRARRQVSRELKGRFHGCNTESSGLQTRMAAITRNSA